MRFVLEDGLGLSAIQNPEPIKLADREEFDPEPNELADREEFY